MGFLADIIERLNDVSGFFYDAYLTVYDWYYPFSLLDEPLYYLSYAFSDLAWAFYYFSQWANDVADRVSEILSTGDIWSYFRWWFDRAEWAWDWVFDAAWYIWLEIEDWWYTTRWTVLDWISDVETWTQSQLNSLQSTLTALITDLELWTTTQLNNLQATFNALITDVELWTTTQLNNLQATFTTLIGNVEAWTITQINNVKSAILAIIGDLETWTLTEISTIQSILTTLIDWAALTTWITTWWGERLLDVQGLIDSAFSIRTDFWAGWQDWRDKVTEFFTDPEDWLYKSLDRIIERFW